jgi:homoserine O-acetyltransferase
MRQSSSSLALFKSFSVQDNSKFVQGFMGPGGRSIVTKATVKGQDMEDEYGKMDDTGSTFSVNNFVLESGVCLPKAEVRFATFGKLNATKDNIIVVCHALTGNARLDEWWAPLLGPGKSFDTDKYFVVCANTIGSCYGSTGPRSINPETGKPYGIDFPKVSIRDSVVLHMRMVKEALGANGVQCVVGGSMGGMQTLEWAIQGGRFVKGAIVIGCGPSHSAWQIGISECQRQAIYADQAWKEGRHFEANSGLSVARQMAMISYRTAIGYQSKFGRETSEKNHNFQVANYLEYQGRKFQDRFDPVSYVRMTEKMDTHDVGRGRGGVEAALSQITAKTLVLAMTSDILYPPADSMKLQQMIPDSSYTWVETSQGHDGFLLEYDQVGSAVSGLLSALERWDQKWKGEFWKVEDDDSEHLLAYDHEGPSTMILSHMTQGR